MESSGSLFLSPRLASVCLFCAVVAGGCATARVELSDQRFHQEALTSERMAIGPVVQVGGLPLQGFEADALRNSLREAIRQRRGYIDTTGAGFSGLISRPGSTAEEALPREVRSTCAADDIRYLLLIELSENGVHHDVDRSRSEETEDICDENGKIIGQRVVDVTFETRSDSTRKVSSRFKVLDLKLGETVWVSRSQSSRTSSNHAESCWCYPPPPPFPSPPAVGDIAKSLTRAAVRKLPRKW